jgi:DNA-binding ferritin-like protein
MKAVAEHYLSNGILEDLETQLDDINERINAVNALIAAKQFSPLDQPKQHTAQPDEPYELRLAKLERETEAARKLVGEWAAKTKRVEDALEEDAWGKGVRGVEEAQEHFKEKLRQTEQDNLAVLKRLGNS